MAAGPGDSANSLKLLDPENLSGTGEVPAATVDRRRARKGGSLHPVLERQLTQAADANGKLRLRELVQIVSRQYDAYDGERASLEEVVKLSGAGAAAETSPGEVETADRLQAILDHVKDGIITCDQLGRIESLNRTAERFFGVRQTDLLSVTLDNLLPELAPGGDVARVLDELAASQDDTHYDLAARETPARHRRGDLMPAEVLVSRMLLRKRALYIVCVRDVTERNKAEAALKDSEARYRVLVENAPEAVVVYDADQGRFVDCNDNAVAFFKMSRQDLLAVGPREVSPPIQADGKPSFDSGRGHVELALQGGSPVFEWMYRDGDARELPCEVRLVRIPSSRGNLLRASIIDITDRKRAENVAAGERKVFEKIASSAGLPDTLESITDIIEQVIPESVCAIRLYDGERNLLNHGAGSNVPRNYIKRMEDLPAEIRYGSCATAVALQRQIIVPDIRKDPFWEHRRDAALQAGMRASWSTPIRRADGKMLGTFAVYVKRTGLPGRRDLELISRMTQLSRIAIERRYSERALLNSEQKFRGLFDNVVEGVYQCARDGRLLSGNPALVQMLGYPSLTALQAVGLTADLYVDPAAREQRMARLVRESRLVEEEYEMRRGDGTIITVSDNARAILSEDGQLEGIEGTLSDVTERKRAEQRLFEEKERAQVTLQSIVDAVITTDRDGIIDYLNPVAENLTGWHIDNAIGQPLSQVARLFEEDTREAVEAPVGQVVERGHTLALSDNTVLEGRKGGEVAIQGNVAPIRDRDGDVVGSLVVFHDVSRERRMRRLLAHQAAHDALTGLINRREFESRVNHAFEDVHRHPDRTHVLVFIDLDRFKLVNDTCGHLAGDELLRQITGLLQTRVRADDSLARLGGDEFGVLLLNCAAESARSIADGMRQVIKDYAFRWEDRTMTVGASIGLVELSHRTESIASLLSAADMACYAAKDGGRNRVHIHDPDSDSARNRELRWVSRLGAGADDGRLEVVFQPWVVASAGSEAHPHYELFARLRDDDGRLVMPDEFLPAAERYNVMPALDRWIVERALRELIPSRRNGVNRAAYTVSVNLSGSTISDQGFLESLIGLLEEYDPTPDVLCLEISESAAVANLANTAFLIRELNLRGCRVALDDFGSGLSSFTYLRNLPVNYVKMDGQFVQGVASDDVDRSMVESMVRVARTLGVQVVAERVETQECFDVLRELGVAFAQGYLFGRPTPIAKFPHR